MHPVCGVPASESLPDHPPEPPTRMKPSSMSAAVVLLLTLLVTLPASAQEPNFGRAIVLEGEDLVIGQPVNWYGPGMVYTYRPDGNGGWVEQSTFAAPDSSRMDDFGRALSLDGSTLAVGAPRKRDGSGVVYLFERTADGWDFSEMIEPEGEADHALFGVSVSLEGDELLVGSPAVDGTGVVRRYTRGADGWNAAGTLAPTDEGAEAFGTTVARAGSAVVIGAPASDDGVGRAYLASRTETGWGDAQRLTTPEGLLEQSGFGASAAAVPGRLAVGAPGAGSVHLYAASGPGSWSLDGTLRAYDRTDGSAFGYALAAGDDALWVGAPSAAGADGRVYRFEADTQGGWGAAVRVDPDETDGDSWPLGFGYALAVDGNQAVVGMPTRDFGEGRAMAFTRTGDGWEAGELLEGQIFRLGQDLATGDRCTDGEMSGEFPCTNMELVSHLPISELGGERGVWVNDVWGWTDPETGRNYALVARRDGASFLDVTDPAAPRLVGTLPRTDGSRPSVWRDIKVIDTHAFIVSDGAGEHGMQVFDLTRLRDVAGAPVEFEPETTYHEIASAHNVVAETSTGYVYIVGANGGGTTCGGGLHIVDVRQPENPTFAGCYRDASGPGASGYTHDAQCLVYQGPDEDYQGREICIGSNASEINIADVTDKQNPVSVARATYPNATYTHQGWFDEEQRYFYQNDEGDETAGVVDRTRTMVWDLTDLDDPILVEQYFAPVAASDHNLYIVGDRMYQSNYGSGLRVIDISDRENPREIAHFDSAPYNDDGPGFSSSESGAWSNYPFFEDGLVIFTSVREGLFIMRVDPPVS